MNRENLKKLADYLLGGKLKAAFNMEYYAEHNGSSTECGSLGCAIGHGPYTGLYKLLAESWEGYAGRVFNIYSSSPEWEWCFSYYWMYVDNTPEGAAKRILYLLEHGLPKNWRDQMNGDAKLCYL